jgi:hypothetical protein
VDGGKYALLGLVDMPLSLCGDALTLPFTMMWASQHRQEMERKHQRDE